MSLKSGTQPKFENKLHCITCGVKRNVSLGMPFPREDGQMGIAFVKIKVLLKLLRTGNLPNEKGLEFPRTGLIAKCPVCHNVTFYDINEKNQLVCSC